MQSAVVQAMRACGRTTLAASSLSGTAARVVAGRRTFLVAPSYKARLAVRGYATAVATKKKATTSSRTTAKKPAAKKATGGRRTTKATAAKKKPVVKSRKVAPKKKTAVKKKPVKREILPERKLLLTKRALRKKALLHGEPKQLPSTMWMVYVSNTMKSSPAANVEFGPRMKAVSAQFKTLSAAEKERLQETADQNKATNAANYRKWVESHTVPEIAEANNARLRLTREFGLKVNPQRITDVRMPKRPVSSFSQFLKSKIQGHDGQAAGLMKDLGAQWKAMSAADKKPYEDLQAAESARYKREMAAI